MLLRELLLFRRTDGGYVPPEVLQALGLPMPENVVEQFVQDHGTKGDFQRQYGQIDLHALRWERRSIPASDLLACSVFPDFTEWVKTVADRTRVAPAQDWKGVLLPSGAAEHWRESGTWMRAPVMIDGGLIDSGRPLHLVEGHTRLGALRGLVECGFLPRSGLHDVWVGQGAVPTQDANSWREVLLTERMPFVDWLIDHMGDDGDLGKIAMRLVDLKHSSRHNGGLRGNDLAAVLRCADADRVIGRLREAVILAHSEWERVMGLGRVDE